MLRTLLTRLKFGNRTVNFPEEPPTLPDRFLGRPLIGPEPCLDNCRQCVDVCPTNAIQLIKQRPVIDLGRCLFCGECARVCPSGVIKFTRNFSLAAGRRTDLLVRHDSEAIMIEKLNARIHSMFNRSLRLRQVSAGGCNGCEVEVNVLGTIVFDLGRFGIQMVASPRHADGLLITGPVTENMKLALKKTYDAVPEPKIVIAVGACAISGGPYIDHAQVQNGAEASVPIDLFIPGCPPHPITILDGLLKLLDKIPR